MISPITPNPQGLSGPTALHEAVVSFGATQVKREEQRMERAVLERSYDPQDQAEFRLPKDGLREAPSQSGAATADRAERSAPQPGGERAGTAHTGASHHRVHHEESCATHAHQESAHTAAENGTPQPRHERADQMREAAVTRKAVEQQGNVEHRRQDIERRKTTRDMIGSLDSLSAAEEPATARESPTEAHGGPPAASNEASVPHHHGHCEGELNAQMHGEKMGGGEKMDGAMRPSGEMVAHMVGSGAVSRDMVAPNRHPREARETVAEEIEGSDEGVHARDDRSRRARADRGMQNGCNFHDGDGGDDEEENARKRSKNRGGDGGGEQQQPPPKETAVAKADVDTAKVGAADAATNARAESVPPPSESDASKGNVTAENVSAVPVRERADSHDARVVSLSSVRGEVEARVDRPAPAEGSALRSGPTAIDSLQRSSTLTPGVGFVGNDEYFFFDDAPPAGAAAS